MDTESVSSRTVFMSYAHKDRERVRPLVAYLASKEFTVVWDEDIEPGTPYRMAIEAALDKAACAVVVWTEE